MKYTVTIVNQETQKQMSIAVDSLDELVDPDKLSVIQKTRHLRTVIQVFIDKAKTMGL